MTDLVGQQLDIYRIEKLLGEGGMGAVYQGLDVNLNRMVAVKVMHRHLARQASFKQRFLQEAQAVARLEHPNIIPLYHFGARDDILYMVMSYVTGGSLEKYVQDMHGSGQLIGLKETLALIAQVAEALDYAHREKIIHRDIKPDNVLLRPINKADRPGDPRIRAMVTDFGLAKMVEGGLNTGLGTMMGTLPYMSPEQCKGAELDGRSDLYSLGIMLYQLTTGQLPFVVKTPVEAANKHLNAFPKRPRELNRNFPRRVEEIIDKALAKKPEERFQTGDDMAGAIRYVADKLTEAELAAFIPDQHVYRLTTKIESTSHFSPPETLDTTAPISSGRDELIIAEINETVQQIILARDFYTIGRGLENDIVLQSDDLSRSHVRLQRTGKNWTVTDLGSTNGTFLEGQKLRANFAAIWAEGDTVRIGSIHLRWRRGKSGKPRKEVLDTLLQPEDADAPVPPPPIDVQATMMPPLPKEVGQTIIEDTPEDPSAEDTAPIPAVPENKSQLFSDVDQFGVTLNPSSVTVEPGVRIPLQIEILNRGRDAEAFSLKIEGIPDEWYTLPQSRLHIQPGRLSVVSLAVIPPRASSTPPGEHQFQVIVTRESDVSREMLVQGTLHVGIFPGFEATLEKNNLRHNQRATVILTNKGNTDSQFTLTNHDPDQQVRLRPAETQLTLAAGESRMVSLRVRSRRKRFFRRLTVPFTIQTASGAVGRRLSGEITVAPRVKFWQILVVLSLAILVALVLGVGEPYGIRLVDPDLPFYIPYTPIEIPSINTLRELLRNFASGLG